LGSPAEPCAIEQNGEHAGRLDHPEPATLALKMSTWEENELNETPIDLG
jgi:hypothetical protein